MISVLLALVVLILWMRLSRAKASIDSLAARIASLEVRWANDIPPVRLKPDSTEEIATGTPPRLVADGRSLAAPEAPLGTDVRRDPRPAVAADRQAPVAAVSPARESLESRIGARWLLYVGVIAVVVGASYFVKLAFDNQWITETGRVAIGGGLGVLLVFAGARFVRAGYPLYGQMIAGGGIAVLYLSIYAAFNFYVLIAQSAAFGLMAVVTALAAWLADRQRSQGLALMAVGGGFATPFLLPSDQASQVALFGYDAMLVAGTVLLAARRAWPALNLVSYAGTVLTIVAWAQRYYVAEAYLTTELFLTLFCGMFLYVIAANRRSTDPRMAWVQPILWTAPLFYYLGSLSVLYDRSLPLLVYLIALHVAGLIAARLLDRRWIRLLTWVAVALPLAAWIDDHDGGAWLITGLTVVSAVYALTLVAWLDATRRSQDGRRPDIADLWLLHLNSVGSFGAAYLLIEPVRLAAGAPLAFAFALWHAAWAAALVTRGRAEAIHFIALAGALAAVAVSLQFDGPWVVVAWAGEGAAIVWLGLRERRQWLRLGGGILLALAVVRLADLALATPSIDQLVLLNRRAASGAFVVAMLYGVAALYRRADPSSTTYERMRALVLVTANVLTLLLLTAEIDAYWQIRAGRDGISASRQLARQLMFSMTWAAYAMALIVVGLRGAYAPIRYLGMALFAVTTAKVFLVDLAELDRIYRVLSIIGLGALLLATSYLYQRYNARLRQAPRSPSA